MEALVALIFFIVIGIILAYLTHRARRSELQNIVLRKQQEKNLALIEKLKHKLYPNGKKENEDQEGETGQEEG